MFKVIFIDDEPWILKGLESVIDWGTFGFEIAGMFDDPNEALAAIKLRAPDAVFTDIRMPEMTGLQLMGHLKDAGLDPLVVIVSAYAEFSYAKEALEKSAFSFVVKPLQESVMIATAKQLRQELEARRITKQNRLMYDNTLMALLHDPIGPSQLESLEHISSLNKPYRVTTIEVKSLPPEHLQIFMRDICRKDGVYSIWSGLFLAIIPASDTHAVSFDSCINYGFSTTGNSPIELSAHIREAMIALYTQKFFGCGPVKYRRPSIEGKQIANEMCQSVIAKTQTWRTQLDEYEAQVKSKPAMLDELMIFYNALLGGLYGAFPYMVLKNDIRELTDCFDIYGVFGDVGSMFSNIRIIVSNFCMPDTKYQYIPDTIAPVIEYVDENFVHAITLEQLSDQFHISLCHLCRQFKKYTGVTYTEYVAGKRVEKACELLISTRGSIADVGTMAGYKDYFYFIKAFKKAMGVSPTQYRKDKCAYAQTEE